MEQLEQSDRKFGRPVLQSFSGTRPRASPSKLRIYSEAARVNSNDRCYCVASRSVNSSQSKISSVVRASIPQYSSPRAPVNTLTSVMKQRPRQCAHLRPGRVDEPNSLLDLSTRRTEYRFSVRSPQRLWLTGCRAAYSPIRITGSGMPRLSSPSVSSRRSARPRLSRPWRRPR